jgi:hypothetical protein
MLFISLGVLFKDDFAEVVIRRGFSPRHTARENIAARRRWRVGRLEEIVIQVASIFGIRHSLGGLR